MDDIEEDAAPVSAEALLAATGIREILSGEPGRITMGDKGRAEMLPREIRRSLARFVAEDDGPQKVGKMQKFDYGWALDHITEVIAVSDDPAAPPSLRPELLEDISAGFRPEDHDLAAGYLALVQKVIPYLQAILPVSTETSSARTTNFDPSDTEIARFRRAFDVANDPMVILRDMEQGILVGDQVQHFEALYPDLFEGTKATLGLAMADALAKKKSWKLPYRKERIVQLIYGTDTMSAALQADLQASFAKQDQTKQGPAPAKSTGKTASMFQSQTQATADGDLRK